MIVLVMYVLAHCKCILSDTMLELIALEVHYFHDRLTSSVEY